MKRHVNLLSTRHRRKEALRRGLALWGGLSAAALVLGVVLLDEARDACRQAAAELDAATRRYEPLRKLAEETRRLRAEIAELRAREELALRLDDEEPVVTLLGLVSRATAQCGDDLYVEELTFERRDSGSSRSAKGDADSPTRVLAIQGLATNNVTIAQLAAALRDTGLFHRVDLKSTGAARQGGLAAQSYSLECVF